MLFGLGLNQECDLISTVGLFAKSIKWLSSIGSIPFFDNPKFIEHKKDHDQIRSHRLQSLVLEPFPFVSKNQFWFSSIYFAFTFQKFIWVFDIYTIIDKQ